MTRGFSVGGTTARDADNLGVHVSEALAGFLSADAEVAEEQSLWLQKTLPLCGVLK